MDGEPTGQRETRKTSRWKIRDKIKRPESREVRHFRSGGFPADGSGQSACLAAVVLPASSRVPAVDVPNETQRSPRGGACSSQSVLIPERVDVCVACVL